MTINMTYKYEYYYLTDTKPADVPFHLLVPAASPIIPATSSSEKKTGGPWDRSNEMGISWEFMGRCCENHMIWYDI